MTGRCRGGRGRPPLAAAAALVAFLAAGGSTAGEGSVRLGDAAAGVVRGSDLARIKRQLDLDDFSIVAAVRLGAASGREALLLEPLDPEARERVAAACARGSFCPDRYGFAGSRLRIILLQDSDVLTILTIDRDARGEKGRLFDAEGVVPGGAELVGWTGWAEASSGHVALSLTPILSGSDGRIVPGRALPVRIRWNDRAERFQLYDCAEGAGEDAGCAFRDEVGH